MKNVLFLSLLVFSSMALADLGEKHAENCQLPEVKKVMGEAGSCRIIIVPHKAETKGSCTGSFEGQFSCTVTYDAKKERTDVNVTCAKDPKRPIVNQKMPADSLGYNVGMLIKNESGKDIVINDKNSYVFINNNVVSLHLSENESRKTLGTLILSLDDSAVTLSNVTCH